jgi:hypothetical protein
VAHAVGSSGSFFVLYFHALGKLKSVISEERLVTLGADLRQGVRVGRQLTLKDAGRSAEESAENDLDGRSHQASKFKEREAGCDIDGKSLVRWSKAGLRQVVPNQGRSLEE